MGLTRFRSLFPDLRLLSLNIKSAASVPSPLKDLIGDPLVYGDWCLRAELTVVKVAAAVIGEIGSVDEPLPSESSYTLHRTATY